MRQATIFLCLLFTNLIFSQGKDITTIFLIRHTETIDDGTRDPELSIKGLERAYHWAQILEKEKIDLIFSTNLKRTKALAKIIADYQGVEKIQIYKRDIDVNAFLEKVKGKTVLITGHSNTTPDFVNKLIGKDKYQQIEDTNYSNLFIIDYYSNEKVNDILLKIN